MKPLFLLLLALFLIIVLVPVVFILNIIRLLYRKESLNFYFYTIAIGLDQFGGSILYQQEDWTVSSYTYYLSLKENKSAKVFMKFIDFLFGKNHCKISFETEKKEFKERTEKY